MSLLHFLFVFLAGGGKIQHQWKNKLSEFAAGFDLSLNISVVRDQKSTIKTPLTHPNPREFGADISSESREGVGISFPPFPLIPPMIPTPLLLVFERQLKLLLHPRKSRLLSIRDLSPCRGRDRFNLSRMLTLYPLLPPFFKGLPSRLSCLHQFCPMFF